MKTEVLGEKAATLSTTNPTWTTLRLNSDLRCENLTTNCLSFSTVKKGYKTCSYIFIKFFNI
jgi:hypothetical protein